MPRRSPLRSPTQCFSISKSFNFVFYVDSISPNNGPCHHLWYLIYPTVFCTCQFGIKFRGLLHFYWNHGDLLKTIIFMDHQTSVRNRKRNIEKEQHYFTKNKRSTALLQITTNYYSIKKSIKHQLEVGRCRYSKFNFIWKM